MASKSHSDSDDKVAPALQDSPTKQKPQVENKRLSKPKAKLRHQAQEAKSTSTAASSKPKPVQKQLQPGVARRRRPSAAASTSTGAAKEPSKSRRRSKAEKAADAHSDIRAHFPVRKSSRVPLKKQKSNQHDQIIDMIRKGEDSPDLNIVDMADKGKGVTAKRRFVKGDYVCEYAGDLITKADALQREQKYLAEAAKEQQSEMMCYMYFLKHKGKEWCVDATHSKRVGRLINHSQKNFNLKTKLFIVDDVPHLGLVATKVVEPDEELLYDYGERNPDTLKALPWLKE